MKLPQIQCSKSLRPIMIKQKHKTKTRQYEQLQQQQQNKSCYNNEASPFCSLGTPPHRLLIQSKGPAALRTPKFCSACATPPNTQSYEGPSGKGPKCFLLSTKAMCQGAERPKRNDCHLVEHLHHAGFIKAQLAPEECSDELYYMAFNQTNSHKQTNKQTNKPRHPKHQTFHHIQEDRSEIVPSVLKTKRKTSPALLLQSWIKLRIVFHHILDFNLILQAAADGGCLKWRLKAGLLCG